MHISNLQAALRSLSFIDGLTGLYNRRGFVTLGDPYIKRAQRQKGQFLIVSADVAGLKQINTAAGYDEGDTVLRAVAEILKKSFRDSDLLARMDGGTFAAMAVDANTDKAPIIATRMQYNVQEWNNRTIRKYQLKLNLGFTEFDPSGAIEDLIARAADARGGRRRRTGPGKKRIRVTLPRPGRVGGRAAARQRERRPGQGILRRRSDRVPPRIAGRRPRPAGRVARVGGRPSTVRYPSPNWVAP